MKLLLELPSRETPRLDSVGGKALSLFRLAANGFPVPPARVLTADFFRPWFDRLGQSETWAELRDADFERWPELCEQLKTLAREFPFDAAQSHAFNQLAESLASTDRDALYAVRSSSPDEDLAAASFAGGYETRLGVTLSELENAVRACFLSSLDFRVFSYKRSHGFDPLSPSIAVLVQEQIDSEVAGVAFSLNPLTNDFDEAVVNANWGLGETVVSGLATPDHFVVDKVSRAILYREIGDKKTIHHLQAGGGVATVSENATAPETPSLDDAQLFQIVDALCRVEALFEHPVDVEWAFARDQLFLLQARPVTGYVPLPVELQTQPGERRRLYGDIALASGLTINAPISTLGLDWMSRVVRSIFRPYLGTFELSLEPRHRIWFFAGHRMYQDLSNMLWLASPQKMAKGMAESDALMAETFLAIDRDRYRAAQRPLWYGWQGAKKLPRLFWRLCGPGWRTLRALAFPKAEKARHTRETTAFRELAKTRLDPSLPLSVFLDRATDLLASRVFNDVIPALAAYVIAHSLVDWVVGKRDPARLGLAQKLKLGFKGNVVAEMGIALHELSGALGDELAAEPIPLAQRLADGTLSSEAREAWKRFDARFGCRGPMEMDIAEPRFGDRPSLALRLAAQMRATPVDREPARLQERTIAERKAAYRQLSGELGPLRRALLRRVYLLLDLFGETRDTPKHQCLVVYHAVRRRFEQEGQRLRDHGRLDSPEHIFDLAYADVELAAQKPDLDLRSLREKRNVFKNRLQANVRSFPGVIDSRGRILRPARRAEEPGQLSGTPISNGVATGPVKVLHTPDEKPVEPGDILVAYTTDPGWTPLFVNAAAVILEIGGVLQHGAVVAREYGKPCVAGVDRVTERLKDGQLVEVDGSRGIVRVIEKSDTEREP